MALGIYFAPSSMTAEQYNQCISQLKKAGAGHPAGRVYHACFGTGDKIQVFDVWESMTSFETFGQTLMPILHGLGVDPGQPMISTVHNVIVPPARTASRTTKRAAKAKPKARAKKAAPKRRARRK